MEAGAEGAGADDGRMAGLERIDEVQTEVNALVRDILLDQVDARTHARARARARAQTHTRALPADVAGHG